MSISWRGRTPTREAWEITDAEGAYRGRVVKAAGGFQALKPFGDAFYQRGDVRLARDSRLASCGPQAGAALRARSPGMQVRPCR